MRRWRVALACLSATMLLGGSSALAAEGFGEAGPCAPDHEYKICRAGYLGGQWWWHEHGTLSTSYPRLVADTRHSEGHRQALELNAANDAINAGAGLYARLAADKRHSTGCQLVLAMNEVHHGTTGQAALPRRAGVSHAKASRAAVAHVPTQLSNDVHWQLPPSTPSWCGCDVAWFDKGAWFDKPDDVLPGPCGSDVRVDEASAAARGSCAELRSIIAALWRSTVKAARGQYTPWLTVCEWVQEHMGGLAGQAAPYEPSTLPGGGTEPVAPVSPKLLGPPPSAYLGL